MCNVCAAGRAHSGGSATAAGQEAGVAMQQKRRLWMATSFIAMVAASAQPAMSATCVWNGGVGLYSDAPSWSCMHQPGGSDDVVITTPSSVVSITNINADAATINLGAGNALNIVNSNLSIHNNAVTNNGTFNISGGANLLSASGTVTFGGTGAIVLDDTAGTARIYSGAFAFGAGQTVSGSGQLGINQTMFSNSGLISANVSTRSIDIDVAGGNGGVGAGNGFGTNGEAGFYNTGTLQATGGGTLNLYGGLYENSSTGLIQALAGSVVSINSDARIVGGTLSSTGTGQINAHDASQYLTSVTLASGSRLDVANDNLYLNTAIANNGTIRIASGGNIFGETGTVSYDGVGTIVLDNSAGTARIYNGNFVFGAGQTVHGAGQLGINQAVFTNNNLISADVSGASIDIDPTGGSGGLNGGGVGSGGNAALLNNGILQATGGATLNLYGGVYEDAAGSVIRATNGSIVSINADARILGGTLSSDATSQINAHGTAQYLNSVTLASGSRLDVDNDNLYLNTAIANNGTIRISDGGNLFSETAVSTINGTGTIVLDDTINTARIYNNAFVFGTGQTVRGSGQIGINQATFTNNGLISADVAGRGISIDAARGGGGRGGGGFGPGGPVQHRHDPGHRRRHGDVRERAV